MCKDCGFIHDIKKAGDQDKILKQKWQDAKARREFIGYHVQYLTGKVVNWLPHSDLIEQ